jgi:predicted nucleic-acid-binding protein
VIALDTNILVRVLINDDKLQAAQATQLIEANACFVPLTVALELEWVLRGVYKLERIKLAALFDSLLKVENLHFESLAILSVALGRYRAGFDFADAVHLAAADGCEALYTFDKKLIALAST